jgi:foldase protein PrsA
LSICSNRTLSSILAAAALVAALCSGRAPCAEGGDVVARVDGEPITRAELADELLMRHGVAVLEDLIREKALTREFARAQVTVSDEEVANEIERERRELAWYEERKARTEPGGGVPRTLEEVAEQKYRMSFEGYRQIIKRWLLIRKVILRRENPTENDILLWFYQNRERYDEPAEVTVNHIYIAKEDARTGRPRAQSEIDSRVAIVRDGLVRGIAFAALATKHSEDESTRATGGKLGTFNERVARATLEPSFVDAMMALKPGQSGGPIETPRGYHFIHVTARQDGRRVEYESIKARVRLEYLEERATLLREVFVRELLDRVKIERMFETPAGNRG